MITHTDIESINRYRSRLGEDLYEHLVSLWEESEKISESTQEGQELLKAKASTTESGDCPTCGHAAEMGVLLDSEGEGQGSARKLWCGYCENLWEYDRIRCTRCGTRSQEALSYHFSAEDDARRVYFCEECDGTQKVLCEKSITHPAEVDIRLESILMTGLEDAVREHCKKKQVAKLN
ncbi:MAG: formate dehydrogenase accessory protein FdhE [Coriobacteriia bacterium]|nr:formate dehydrogenase accessory protein FdhE [Coriobacteriia bacterium]MCL2746007.1 formate dehydrogenase accessory protein FdhE [Coriobacteriia bacterium]MCL2870710.1 formate dehydrogenase accessory protein FdhE [Coriobacteriia bacterium]